jgi:ribonuclease Z
MGRRVALFVFVVVVAALAVTTTYLGNRMSDVTQGATALTPRNFAGATVVFVGTGGTHPNQRRRGPAIAVGSGETVILFDAGRGVAEGLRVAEIPASQPSRVFLTSLLPENTVGLDDLLLSGWLDPRERPLKITGPPGTRTLVEGLLRGHAASIAAQGDAFGLPPAGASVEVSEISAETTLQEGDLTVRAVPLQGGPAASAAYRVERGNAAMAFGGASWDADRQVDLARGVRVWVHEAHFAESVEMAIEAGAEDADRLRKESGWRTPIPEAGGRARRAGARSLALVRLRPPPLFDFQVSGALGSAYGGDLLVPDDGDEIELTP